MLEVRVLYKKHEAQDIASFELAPVAGPDLPAFSAGAHIGGRVIVVGPEQSAAQALEDGGFAVALSCEQGVCGTCITRVLDGTPDHKDMYFTDAEHARNDCFTPCCSRALSPRLVLDL